MKRSLVQFVSFFVTVFGFQSMAHADPSRTPVKVPSPVEKIFVPFGFDSNDNSEIILHGHFSSSCMKVGDSSFKVNGSVIEVEAYALKYEGAGCKDINVPFVQSVKLGLLEAMSYTIKYKANETVRAEPLTVALALRSEPDDFLYASVATADLNYVKRTGDYELTVEGYYPYFFIGCMTMDHVKSYLAPGNVVIVQPVAKMLKDEDCQNEDPSHHFKVSTKVDFPVDSSEHLIHVRVLDGNSYNRLIEHIE